MQISIKGQVPSKKNSRRPFIRNGRIMNFPSQKHEDWLQDALRELHGLPSFTGKVKIDYYFYVKDNRKRDIDNMIASINDALVKAKIIKEDSWQYLKIVGGDAAIDRDNPRAEIDINETR